MDIRPIHNEAEYDAALAEIDQYFVDEPKPGSSNGDRFEVLLALIAAYENERWPIEPPAALGTVRMVMEIKGYTRPISQACSARVLALPEILSGKRS